MSDNLMTLTELYEKHSDLGQDEVILDVRRPDEYQDSHIANSINIPLDQITSRADELKKFSKVYIHCKRGGRAKTAFEALSGLGLKNLVCVHDAGMDLWLEKGYPAVRG